MSGGRANARLLPVPGKVLACLGENDYWYFHSAWRYGSRSVRWRSYSLVEARALAEMQSGVDISSLASPLLARVKTTPLRDADISGIEKWLVRLPDRLNLRNTPVPAQRLEALGYQKTSMIATHGLSEKC